MELINKYYLYLKSLTSGIHDPLVIFIIIAVAGVLVGKLFHKIKLPDISGQVIIGILIGFLFTKHQLHSISYISDIALGYMTFTIGTHLNFKVLHNSRGRILKLSLFDAFFVFTLVFASFYFLFGNLSLVSCLLIAAIAIETAPGTIITLIQKKYSRGVFTKTLVGVVALNNFATIIVFVIAKFIGLQLIGSSGGGQTGGLTNPFVVILLTIGYGVLSGFALKYITKHQHSRGDLFGSVFLLVLINIIICNQVGMSHLLVNLILGIVFCNTSYHTKRVDAINKNITELLFAVFFTLAGTHLDLSQLKIAGIAGIVFVIVRIIAKSLGAFTVSKLFNYPKSIAYFLGLGLIPQAGLAIGLVISLSQIPAFSEIAPTISTIILAAVAVNELIGPFTTSRSMDLAKETGQATPRLIDFLHEEYILTTLEAKDKWGAISQMTDFLVKTNHLRSITRDELLKYTIERESHCSTGIGRGVAIPHARIPKTEKLMGVIGVSKEPVDFDCADKKPVQIIFLIATPEGQEDIHVKLLAAISKIFVDDPQLSQKIISASSPAEVYDLFQSKQVRDINSFLEDMS